MLGNTSLVFLLKLLSAVAFPIKAAGFPVSAMKIDNLQSDCLSPMIIAKNNDHMITAEELPTFINSLSIANGVGTNDPKFSVTTWSELHWTIRFEFNQLICYGKSANCSPKSIDVSGAVNFDNADAEQKAFLKKVCKDLISTMKKALGPSNFPSSIPSGGPSFFPSTKPSSQPSGVPTDQPTNAPSISPSATPSQHSTPSPSGKPVLTSSPSGYPSDKPSETPVETAIVPFGLLNMYGLSAEEIAENVGGTMTFIDSVFSAFSGDIESKLFTQTIGGSNRKLRRSDVRILEVEFQNEQYVTNIEDKECPTAILNQFKDRSPAPKCQHMSGIISYVISEPTNPEVTQSIIKTKAGEGIQQNRLNDKVPEELRNDYVFYSIDGNLVTIIPVAAITGIAIGAALIGLIAGRLLMRRRGRSKNAEQYDGLNGPSDTMEEDEFNSSRDNYSPYKGLAEDSQYRREVHDLSLENSVASSSNAGSSGWSSSAGISSLNTGSVDSSEYFGSSLAAIGAASNISKRYKSKDDVYPVVSDIDESSMSESDIGMSSELETDDESNIGHGNRQFGMREELEAAIQNGEWSLVGATAAIIAQAPADFVSNDMNTTFSSALSSVGASPRKSERAMELDKLVEAGDWEGVVLAAAKFETEDDRDIVTEGSASMSEGQQFLAARSLAILSDGNSTNSPSVSTNISESASNMQKRAEIRAEVEELVSRVVPDEIDNVDEMMHQFKGREEELVETLRTMQERHIAARQREAMRRNAKREARKMAKQNKPPTGKPIDLNRRPVPVQDRVKSNETNSSFYSASSSGENDCKESKENSKSSYLTPSRAALDHAIKMGDWEAVGRTAEQLNDGSESETSEYESADDNSMMSARSQPSHPDADRAAELEGLIDRGDWSAVVAAASRFASDDMEEMQQQEKRGNKSIPPGSLNNSNLTEFDDAVSQTTEVINTKAKKEEEDALAQAEIWMTIAAQSKKEGSSATKGASDAADWAISQSLKQIQATSDDNNDTQSAASSCDDKSV